MAGHISAMLTNLPLHDIVTIQCWIWCTISSKTAILHTRMEYHPGVNYCKFNSQNNYPGNVMRYRT